MEADGSGAPSPVCEPVGGPCSVDEDEDDYGVGTGCMGADRDDGDGAIHSGQADVCNGVDDDCDGAIDEDGGTETLCADGSDNDCDGLIDCADPSCNTMTCGIGGRVCSGGACVCPSGGTELCGDGADNDCDGMIDCGDADRDGMACGSGGRTCAGRACTCRGGEAESICMGGMDDDCDGAIDCADSDCAAQPCGANGRVCSGLVCACPGTSELCNGGDDDCDAATDEGCPSGLGLGSASSGTSYGGSGGTPFSVSCAAGAALTAFDIRAGGRVDRLVGVCRAASLRTDTTARPEYTYSLVTGGASMLLPAQGGTGGTLYADGCGADEVVIGIEGRAGSEVDRFSMVCGTVTSSGAGAPTGSSSPRPAPPPAAAAPAGASSATSARAGASPSGSTAATAGASIRSACAARR